MGKTRQTGNIVSDGLVSVDIDNDQFKVGTGVTIYGSSGIISATSLYVGGTQVTGGGGGSGVASTITVADESSDTTCFPIFSTAATGDVNPKTGSNLTFDSSNGRLTATSVSVGSTTNIIRKVTDVNSWVAVDADTSFNVVNEQNVPTGLYFKSDGTKMFVTGTQAPRDVEEYALSSAWDITTASHTTAYSLASQDTAPQGLYFSPNGQNMFVAGNSSDSILHYTLSTGWDLSSTVSYVGNFSVSSQDTNPTGVTFGDSGTKMYVVGRTNDSIYQYNLSSAYTITSGVSLAHTLDIGQSSSIIGTPNGFANPHGISISSDGTKIWIIGTNEDIIAQFNLGTAYDLSTATYNGDLTNIFWASATAYDLYIDESAGKGFVLFAGTNDKVIEIDITNSGLSIEANPTSRSANINLNNNVQVKGRTWFEEAIVVNGSSGASYFNHNIFIYGQLTCRSVIDLADGSADRIQFGASDDAKIYYDGTDNYFDLQFSSADNNGFRILNSSDSELFRVAKDGKVGINSTTPTADLDVNGDVNVSGALTATSFSGSGSSLTGLTGASAATYGSATATPVIVVNSDGRITGISTVATSGSGGGAASEAFKTIAVSGQSDVVADTATDTLTLVGGTNIDITTNASTDTVTIASSAGIGLMSFARIADVKSAGSDGGVFSSGNWRTRTLNTELSDDDNIVSLSSNQFTLQAGKYRISWRCPANRVDVHISRLYNITSSSVVVEGTSEYSQDSNYYAQTTSTGTTTIDISSATVFEIQHRCSTSYTGSDGFGVSANVGQSQTIFTDIVIEKYSDIDPGGAAGSNGQIQYNNGSVFGGASQLYYDDVNNRLGINSTTPTVDLDVNGDVNVSGALTATSFSGSGANLTNVNATTLDSIDSGSFLRSDVPDVKTSGALTFNDGVYLIFGTNSDVNFSHTEDFGSGTNTLNVSTDDLFINDGSAARFKLNNGGDLEFKNTSGTTKLKVIGTGATVVGDLYATTLYGDGSNLTGISGGGGGVGYFATTTNGVNYTGIGTISAVGIGTKIEIVPYDDQDGGTLSFEGSAGNLFSVTNNLSSGSIFAVNDISGSPSIDVNADGTVLVAPYSTTEKVGVGTVTPGYKLDVVGDLNFTGTLYQNGSVFNPGVTPSGGEGAVQFNSSSNLSGISTLLSVSSSDFSVGIGTIINIKPYDDQDGGTLSFEGSAGNLLSITNNLSSGSIFAVNDISGAPSIDVNADGTVSLNGTVEINGAAPVTTGKSIAMAMIFG